MDLRAKIHHLLTQNVSPHKVASGSAIGMFFGFLPLFGLKTLLSYFLSLAFRVNTTAAVIAVTLHDVLIPFTPVILRVEYQIGFWLLAHPHAFAPKMKLSHVKLNPLKVFQNWKDFERVGVPLLLGSLIFGLVAAVVAYGVTYLIFRARQKRQARHAVKALVEGPII